MDFTESWESKHNKMQFSSRHLSREILSTAFYEPKIKIKSLKETYKPCMTFYAI